MWKKVNRLFSPQDLPSQFGTTPKSIWSSSQVSKFQSTSSLHVHRKWCPPPPTYIGITGAGLQVHRNGGLTTSSTSEFFPTCLKYIGIGRRKPKSTSETQGSKVHRISQIPTKSTSEFSIFHPKYIGILNFPPQVHRKSKQW